MNYVSIASHIVAVCLGVSVSTLIFYIKGAAPRKTA